MQKRAASQKALVPSKSKKHMQEIDLTKLTRSKRALVVEQALEVQPVLAFSNMSLHVASARCVLQPYTSRFLQVPTDVLTWLQSKDADAEKFFGKLKDRLNR